MMAKNVENPNNDASNTNNARIGIKDGFTLSTILLCANAIL